MKSKYGLISIVFGIVGIVFLFLFIIPITAFEASGWGGSPNWILFFSIEFILGILTVSMGFTGKNKDESKKSSIAGLIIGCIIIIAWILAILSYIM